MRAQVATTRAPLVGASATKGKLPASGRTDGSLAGEPFSRSPHRLTWQGRVWSPGKLDHTCGTSACHVDELYGDGSHRLVRGDALDVAAALVREGVRAQLVYVDPPFASQTSYVHEARLDGRADGRVRRARAYDDSWSAGAYLDMLAPRLEALTTLLAPEGTLWVHLDWRAAYLVRALLDEILGPDRFLNEIVWRRAPNLGRQAASAQFGRTLDTLVVYGGPKARLTPPTRLEPIEPGSIRRDDEGRPFTLAPRGDYTDASVARLEKEGRIHRTATGKVYVKYFLFPNDEGRLCRERRVDALWTDVAPLRHAAVSERTGYPTQKPRALLERIIRASTRPGDTVIDLFCGSGTTGDAAHATDRRAILGDAGPIGLATTRARLLRAGAGLRVERVEGGGARQAAGRALDVRCRVSDGPNGALEVELVSPEEPAAWAIGTMKGTCFSGLWHAERALGTRPVPPERRATIAAGAKGELVARAYADDGACGDAPLAPTKRAKKPGPSRARRGA